jgi:probable HAF family extracellular repeat protein
MALVEDTNLRGRARLPVVVAVVLTALAATTASARRMDQPGAGTPSQCSEFMLDRGRYTTVDLPCQTNDIKSSINNRGQITGVVLDSDGGFHGLIRDQRDRRTRIDVPGAAGTAVFGLNDRGEVVGVYSDTDPQAPSADDRQGFLRDARGRFTRLRVPGSVNTQAFGINNRGQVVGEYLDCAGTFHGFLWEKGRFTTIDGPDGAVANALNINDKGEVVGAYIDPTAPGTIDLDGFLLSKGVYRTFDAPTSRSRSPSPSATGGRSWASPPPVQVFLPAGSCCARGPRVRSPESSSRARPEPAPPVSTTAARSSASTRTPRPRRTASRAPCRCR